jgi:DNA replication regulator SLD3
LKNAKDSKPQRGEPSAKGSVNSLKRPPLQKTSSLSAPGRSRPTLGRAATDSEALIPGLKREGSEKPSLMSIPLLQSRERERKGRRDSSASLKHLQARQISLGPMASAADAKRKRKAAADDEIREAINSIKKPNRTGAGREIANERDRRIGTGSKTKTQPRAATGKTAQGDRKALHSVENVQVLATPHIGRKIDIFAQQGAAVTQHTRDTADLVPSSASASHISDSIIPASTIKPQSSATNRQHQFAITETPSKSSLRQRLFASPEPCLDDHIPDSAIKPRSIASAIAERPQKSFIESTPIKRNNNQPESSGTCLATPVPAAKTRKNENTSIYDMLGWNDYT